MAVKNRFELNTQNTILSLITMVVFFFVLIWLVRGIFTILAWIAPILLIITLIINHKIVLNYGKWLWRLLKEKTTLGVVASLLTVVGFPVVSLLLFGRAMLQRKVQQLETSFVEKRNTEFTDYEIVEEETTRLELPPLKQKVVRDDASDYEELFD